MTATARTIRWIAVLLGCAALLAFTTPRPASAQALAPVASATTASIDKALRPKAVVNPGGLSGLWYDPMQSGQGFSFSFNAAGTVAVTWYVYNQTNQIWLVGSANLVDNTATVPVFISSGANFFPGFDPQAVTLTPWGTLTLTVRNCALITVAWNSTQPGYGAGSVDVVPLIVAGGLPCQVTNVDDHGGTCAEATVAPNNGSVSGRIDPQDDEDFFRIDVAFNGVVEVRSSGGGESFDPFGTLYDAGCNALVDDDDSNGSRNFLLSRGVAAGTYYIRAKSFNSETRGDYSLAISYEVVAPGSDDHGDDCTTATAAPIAGTASGTIDPSNDYDYFRVDATQAGILQVTSTHPGDLDPVGALLDANCQLITENDDATETKDFLIGALVSPGPYYVRVRSYEESSTGAYTIATTFSTSNTSDDHGDFCGNATLVQPTSTTNGEINPRFDVDIFRVDVPTRGMIVFDATRVGDIDPVDPLIQVLDGNCDGPFFEDDDGGPGQNSRLAQVFDVGTYYVRVRSYNDDTFGPYTLGLRYYAQTPGPDEHGDSCATATQLGQFGQGNGRIDPANDVDYFRIDAEFESDLSVFSYDTSTLNPTGALLDANCNELDVNDDADTQDFAVGTPATPGTYFIRIASSGGASSGDYTFGFFYGSGAKAARDADADASKVGAIAASAAPTNAAVAAPAVEPLPKREGGDPARLALDSARHARALDASPKAAMPKAVANPASLSGLWYDPARPGQGFSFSFDQNGTVAVTWYVYNGGRQVWLVGSGPLQGNRAVLPTVITNGALFPPGFASGSVVQTNWGTLTLDVRSCSRIDVAWNSVIAGYGSGSLSVEPLIVAGGLPCAVSSETDDHGNTCAAATVAATNGSSTGRIDPASDQDYFRFSVGSNGTFTVQSSDTSTLNAAGGLLDANCAVLAESDNAAGREFAITRALTPGTYHVRVASSGAASVGNYSIDNAFSTSQAASGLTLSLRNELLYDVDFRANGGTPIRVAAQSSVQRAVSVTGPLSVTFALVGAVGDGNAPIGDLQGGVFDPVASPSGTIQFTVNNQVGNQIYFAPSVTNSTPVALLIGVNMATADENRCNCVVDAGGKDRLVGYYRLLANSNVRGYNAGSGYSGSFTSLPAPGIPIPLSGFVETPSGRVAVNFKRPP